MSVATLSTSPRTKAGGINRLAGFVWDNSGKHSPAQYFAEQFFILCRGRGAPENYVSDLYWDFAWAQEHEREYREAPAGVLFVYVLRENGTHLFATWAAYLEYRRHLSTVRAVFVFEKEKGGCVRVREVEA